MLNQNEISAPTIDHSAQVMGRIKDNRQDTELLSAFHFLWLEITNQCNLRCSHCYAESGPDQPQTHGLLPEDWENILQESMGLGCKRVQFIGGEPTLYPYLPRLMQKAYDLQYEFIEVFTNGTRIKPALFDVIRRLGIRLSTSFYSEDAEIHDRITKGRGSHAKTVDMIKKAISYGVPIRVGIIEMEENAGTVSRTTKYLNALGVSNANIGGDKIRGIGRAQDRVPTSNPIEQLCGSCWRGTLAINSAGQIAPCIMSHFRNVGHVSDGLATVLAGDQLNRARHEIRDAYKIVASCRPDESCYPCSPQCNPQDQCFPDSNCPPTANTPDGPGCAPCCP
jgi:MoaA/NifB/PqqE/SkfB family radical SAM enzyme